jgi:hypothetical protein
MSGRRTHAELEAEIADLRARLDQTTAAFHAFVTIATNATESVAAAATVLEPDARPTSSRVGRLFAELKETAAGGTAGAPGVTRAPVLRLPMRTDQTKTAAADASATADPTTPLES